MGCKRILLSNDYLPGAHRAERRRGHRRPSPGCGRTRVVTADGVEHAVDTIILGTGFHVTDLPIADRVRGRDGRTLAEHWTGSPQAHRRH